ncbi:MAG TPA: hypothetical protein VL100_01945 [Croceibacterium sp.]|nr:hypothetical protein [Croceibacterium sp.]
MFRPILPLAILALGVSGTLIHAAGPSPHPVRAIDDIEWSYAGGDNPRVRLTHDGMNSTMDTNDLPRVADGLATASSSPGEAVSFNLAREAGALACTGAWGTNGKARGTCRFDPSEAFVGELAARGLRPEDSDEAFALALVDARVGEVDALERAGFDLTEVDDLLAVSALEVTADYAGELRTAGLAVDELDDLVAARALEISPRWLVEMAEAGYPGLTADQAISMRALDVTPDYARRMKRVASAVGELM